MRWAPAWQLERTLRQNPRGSKAIADYHASLIQPKASPRDLPARTLNHETAWTPDNTKVHIGRISPDLDIQPTGKITISRHPDPEHKDLYVLHTQDGQFVTTLANTRVHALWERFQPHTTLMTFQEAVYAATARIGTKTSIPNAINNDIMKNRWALNSPMTQAQALAYRARTERFSDSHGQACH